MKKIFLIILLFTGVLLAQIDTIKVLGYTTGTQIKTALDKAGTSFQKSDSNGVTGFYKRAYIDALLSHKQATLTSGTNIKTVNNTSLLGSGNITITSDTSGFYHIVNDLVTIVLSNGDTLIGTKATLDSLISDYWNDNLGGGTAFDSTYTYQRIVALENDVSALEDSVNSIKNILNAVLTILDSLGYQPDLSDNTPPTPPDDYVAIGGTSQTQYVCNWTDPTAVDLDSLRWYEGSTSDTASWNWIASINKGVETYIRTGRSANTTYWSGIKALDDSSNLSWFSNIDSARTISGALTENLIATSGDSTGASDGTTFAAGKEKSGDDITPASTYSVSRIDFAVGQVNGTKTGYYKAQVWTMTGDNLTSLVATSLDSIAGTALVTTGWNKFHFTSYVTLTSGTKYALLMSKTSAGDNNNAQLRYGTSNWTPTSEVAQSFYWTAAGAYVYKYDGEWTVRFYGQ